MNASTWLRMARSVGNRSMLEAPSYFLNLLQHAQQILGDTACKFWVIYIEIKFEHRNSWF